MTVDFIFELLNSFFPSLSGNEVLIIISMLIPNFALFGFITVYGFGVIYAELKVSSFIQDKTGPMGQGYGFHAGKWEYCNQLQMGCIYFLKKILYLQQQINHFLYLLHF